MTERKEQKAQPDFSAADPTEAIQGKAARKFLSAEKAKSSFDANGGISFNMAEKTDKPVASKVVIPVEPFDEYGGWDQKFAKPAKVKF